MTQRLNTAIQELDVIALTHDIQEHGLKQGDRGAVVHCYRTGEAFEVEFVNTDGRTRALLTLAHTDIQKVEIDSENVVGSTQSGSKTMSDQPKVQMNFNAPVTGAAGNVEGDMVINVQQEQNLAAAAKEIQQLLDQLSQTYPHETDRQIEAVKREVKQNPTFRSRLISAAKAGGVEAVKQILDYVFKNPVASVVAEAVKAFVETEA